MKIRNALFGQVCSKKIKVISLSSNFVPKLIKICTQQRRGSQFKLRFGTQTNWNRKASPSNSHGQVIIVSSLAVRIVDLQSFTKYLRLTLDFISNSALWERLNFGFSRVFLVELTKFSFRQGDCALGYHSMAFRHFLDVP